MRGQYINCWILSMLPPSLMVFFDKVAHRNKYFEFKLKQGTSLKSTWLSLNLEVKFHEIGQQNTKM